jgi:hypothetical protein
VASVREHSLHRAHLGHRDVNRCRDHVGRNRADARDDVHVGVTHPARQIGAAGVVVEVGRPTSAVPEHGTHHGLVRPKKMLLAKACSSSTP